MSELPCPDNLCLDELLQGQLPAAQTAEIERHVESCPRCLAELERITTPAQPWIDDFRRFASTADETPIDFQKVLDRIGELSRVARNRSTPSVPQRLIETNRIGDYDLLGELRGGGMGRVFRVRSRSTSEIFALKILTPERLPRPESVERFQREIRLLRDLRHQHVVRAIDSGLWLGVPFVVMEFLSGIDLDELIRRHGPLGVPDAMELARQIALGLRYVHELKLVHRDIKPSNVILTADRACLLDLGLARVAETDWDATGPTMTGEALGTLRYAAPEQLGRAHHVDSRADLYGLGGTLLWLLTGQPPFADADPREVWRLKLGDTTGSDPLIESLGTRLDAEVLKLVCRLLASSPDDRPSSVGAVLPDLERFAAGHQVGLLWERASSACDNLPADSSERPINVVMTVLEAEPQRIQLRRWIVGLTSLLVIAAVWLSLINNRDPPRRGPGNSERWNSSSSPQGSGQKGNSLTSHDNNSLEFAADFRWPRSRVSLETVATTSVHDQPLSTQALVSQPSAIAGIDSWTVETRQPRSHLYEVAFSADGRCYATGDDAGVVRVFESATDRLLRMFVVGSRVRSLDWSSAGPWLAIGCSEPEVIVFDAAAGKRLAHLRLEYGIAHCLRWHPDGVMLAATGGKGFLIHDLKTSSSREVIVPDNDGVVSLNWSPEGTRVVTGDRRGRIRIWNSSDGALHRELARQPARLSHVAWSPDGNAMSFATDKGQVEVVSLGDSAAWSLTGHLPQAFPLDAVWLNATTLLTNDGLALRWFQLPETRTPGREAERLEPVRTQMNPLQFPRQVYGGGVLHRLAVSRDGTQAVSALRFARRVWRLDLAAGTNRVVGGHQSASGFDSRAAWSPRGRWIAFAQQTRGAWVLDARTLEPRHFVSLPEALGSLAWSPDDERLAVIETGRVSLFSNLATETLERRGLPSCGSVTGSWSCDGRLLATSGWGEKRAHSLRLLDTASWGEALRTPLASDAYLIHAWSPDQKSLAIGTDQEVLVFDVTSREWRQTFSLGNRVNGLSWHPSEKLLAAITFDGRPRIINLETGDTRELDAIGSPATGILWSADGRRITVQFGREMVCFDWPAGTLRWRQPLNGHSIESLSQSPNSETLVVAINGELRLHDSATGRRVVTLVTIGEQQWLRLSPDGHFAGSPSIESELAIVSETNGVQSVATLAEFATRTGWKNEPSRAELTTLNPGRHGWAIDAPLSAIAPFSAEQAANHQAEWAKHLGLPAEIHNSMGMSLRLIPPGEFLMGGTDEEVEWTLKFTDPANEHTVNCAKSERPQHRVTLTQPFYLGRFEVTQSQFEAVMGRNPALFAKSGSQPELAAKVAGMDTSQHPVENVSRSDAAEFCIELSKQENLKPFYFRSADSITELDGTGYRLPTEAEWEFACRAGTLTSFWSGSRESDFLRVGWGADNSGLRTHPVGELPANPFGLNDIHGNVFEWTQDRLAPAYYSQLATDTTINPNGTSEDTRLHITRGGSWITATPFCRSAFRIGFDFTMTVPNTGFRVVLPIAAVRRPLQANPSDSPAERD